MKRLKMHPLRAASGRAPWPLRLALAFASVIAVHADYYTYPVKSVNLDAAMQPDWYKGFGPASGTTDAHGVHGIETSDGGYVVCGKSAAGTASPKKLEAWALKTSATGALEWRYAQRPSASSLARKHQTLPGHKNFRASPSHASRDGCLASSLPVPLPQRPAGEVT